MTSKIKSNNKSRYINENFVTDDGFDLDKLSIDQLQKFFHILICFVYNYTKIEFVQLNKLIYYNRTNDQPEGTDSIPDHESIKYDECNDVFETNNSDIIKYNLLLNHLMWNETLHYHKKNKVNNRANENKEDKKAELDNKAKVNNDKDKEESEDEEEDEDEEDPVQIELGELIWDVFEHNKWSDVKLHFSPKYIELINKRGFNNDHRGSNNTKVTLDFHDKYVIKNKSCTIGNFADACYRIKSHKFDYWYELYTYVLVSSNGRHIKLNFEFDHGS